MVKCLIIANESDVDEVHDDSIIEGQLATQENEIEHIQDDADVHAEAEGMLETTNDMIQVAEASVETGTGLAEETSTVMNSALEHFHNRAGINLNGNKVFALESFKEQNGRLAATKVAIESMKTFDGKLAKALVISQEGMLSRLGNTFKLAFSSQDKIHDNILLNMANLKSRGVKDALIKQPGWGRSFAIQGKRLITGTEVVSLMKNYSAIVTSSQMKSLLNNYTDILEKITKEISKSSFIANDEATKNIYDLSKQCESFRVKVDKIISDVKKPASNDPDYVPLKEAEAQKLTDMVDHMFTDSQLETAIRRCEAAIENANSELYAGSMTRLAGEEAADIRAARVAINKTNDIISDISYILTRMNRVAFACSNYIKASTAR
jgi:hypothetical protein